MKKLLLAVVAMTMTASAFAAGENMVRLYGWDAGDRGRSFDFSMASDDSDAAGETSKEQSIVLNYARAFGQWQVGLVYQSESSETSTTDNAGSSIGLSGYYNLNTDLQNTCYFALHYVTHTASDGSYTSNWTAEGIGEDDSATSIVLEYGHRWAIGTGWGFHVTYSPSVMYNMTTYDWDNEADDDNKGASETSLAWNFLKFDVMF
ncbi:MAG: hypothetical protein CME65_15475 [Halobacteriovoraceae bacterium]|nr:hypothetical protein [Halobacteriovoraceae bacterium]|tara:strand:+ start:14117 stop:14731 length:615 start_codon:yes stop_codon:yes gene_type:complete